jgi:hypothetical protein
MGDETAVLQEMHPKGASSANTESRLGFLFGVLLLIIAGSTATYVGYKVKTAQQTRKAAVASAFAALAGVPSSITDSSKVIPLPSSTSATDPARRNFVSVYQLNEWVRTWGLGRSLQALDPTVVVDALRGLEAIGASEAFHATEESWALMHDEGVPSPSSAPPTQRESARAARIARRYDRSFIRDVEAKLYRYLEEHKGAIEVSPR